MTESQPMEQSEKRADDKTSKTASGTITQTRVDIQSGLFTKATVNQVPCSLLVDTGATMTIFSHAIFEKIERSRRDKLTPVKQEIVLADGAPLQVKGRCQLQILFHSRCCYCRYQYRGDIGFRFS